MQICSSCGAESPNNASVCMNCGRPLTLPERPVTQKKPLHVQIAEMAEGENQRADSWLIKALSSIMQGQDAILEKLRSIDRFAMITAIILIFIMILIILTLLGAIYFQTSVK